jgi:hypothetical protein
VVVACCAHPIVMSIAIIVAHKNSRPISFLLDKDL